MPLFRNRPDRIRGIAGSLDSKRVLIVEGTRGSGPGIVRVIAEAGANTVFVGDDHVAVDLLLRKLVGTPHDVDGIALDQDSPGLEASLEPTPHGVVINPSRLTMGEGSDVGPQQAVGFADLAATKMRDEGRTGSIVLITGIARQGPTSAAHAYMRIEMEQLAARVAPNGIRVNAVAPGQVAVNRRGNPVSSRVAPLGHSSVHPVEVGKASWFLINDDLSGGITGSTLTVDRGASLARPEL
jgi:NAD(P)-dependent dehydrogenase (short-subunit alcohol dehydrogenase family)